MIRQIVGAASIWATLAACPNNKPVGYSAPPPDEVEVTDPVSGRRCAKAPETRSAVLDSKTYYFCDEASWQSFSTAPRRYGDRG